MSCTFPWEADNRPINEKVFAGDLFRSINSGGFSHEKKHLIAVLTESKVNQNVYVISEWRGNVPVVLRSTIRRKVCITR